MGSDAHTRNTSALCPSVVPKISAVSLLSSELPMLARIERSGHDVVQNVVRQIEFITPYRNSVRNCSTHRISKWFRQMAQPTILDFVQRFHSNALLLRQLP